MPRSAVIAFALCLAATLLGAQSPPSHWVATWAAAPETPNGGARYYEQETVREIVHVSVGGEQARVRLSNQFGEREMRVAGAHVALSDGASRIAPGSDRALTFNGQKAVTIPAGAVMWSAPVTLTVPAMGDLAVSLYFAAATPATTVHTGALQTNYEVRGGDLSAALDFGSAALKLTSYPFVTGVDVADSGALGVVVALGDSITDGFSSHTDSNHRWPNFLAERLHSAGKELGVVNASIFTAKERFMCRFVLCCWR